MSNSNPYILSLAGLDPSGGAGLLADVKVFENFALTGLGVATSITYQNESEFAGVKWLDENEIVKQLRPLSRYRVKAVKIGLIENQEVLNNLIIEVKRLFPDAKIVWDPILKASAGFSFHNQFNGETLKEILKNTYCVTPNIPEAKMLGSGEAIENALLISHFCYVVLKGGHQNENADDQLIRNGAVIQNYPHPKIEGLEKHGSGCVFSSALASSLANDYAIEDAVKEAKDYTLAFLKSSDTLLGIHRNLMI